MKQKKQSPCLTCTRVKDPENCENKLCNPWRQWFMTCWQQLRQQFGLCVAPAQPADPCHTCTIPSQQCDSTCRRKRAWRAAIEEAHP